TPSGFTPGTTSGTYQWDATYNGDANNNTASDVNNPTEQVTANPPPVTLTTIPVPTAVTLGASSVTLNDTAVLQGGVNPTGTITFTLVAPGGATVDSETVTANGNGPYTTPTGFTLPSSAAVTGTYQWDASYSGDSNNNTVSDVNNVNEQVTVSAASPTIFTAPTPTTVTLGASSVTLTDVARISNGF